MLEKLKEAVCEAIDEKAERLIGLSHDIHSTPELAFREIKSSARLAEFADREGLSVERGVYGLETALQASFGNKSHTIGILSEYDALPGIGHACGHNIIAAAGLGAALALKDLGKDLPGNIRWIGTPAEERGCGKELMAQQGAFDGLDAAMMVHPAGVDAKSIRTLCIADAEVVFTGRSAHAAVSPHGGLNALDAAVIAYQAAGLLRQHLPYGDLINAVISTSPGTPNVIPAEASIGVFLRAPTAGRLNALRERFQGCMRAGASSTGCSVRISWANADYLDFKANGHLADAYEENARMLGRTFIDVKRLPAGGSDIGNVSHRVPTLHPLIAASPPQVMIHDPEFTKWSNSGLGDKAVVDGAKALAMTALDFFLNDDLRGRVNAEFIASKNESDAAILSAWRDSAHIRHAGAGCC